MGEVGGGYHFMNHVFFDLAFRYTRVRYSLPGGSLDGSNGGLLMGIYPTYSGTRDSRDIRQENRMDRYPPPLRRNSASKTGKRSLSFGSLEIRLSVTSFASESTCNCRPPR
jgi:hypothetical protein